MNEEELKNTVRKLLVALGSTGAEVAQSLEEDGIQGRRRSSTHCPLAEFIRHHISEVEGVYIGTYAAYVRTWDNNRNKVVTAVFDLPSACEAFVTRFDEGAYEELELPLNESS